MSTQPEALRLAECLDEPLYTTHNQMKQAAAELRQLHELNVDKTEIIAAISVQRDAMQERAEYWKRKHDQEETGAERYALRVQRDALLEALRPFAETDLTNPTVRDTFGFNVLFARAAIKAVEGEKT